MNKKNIFFSLIILSIAIGSIIVFGVKKQNFQNPLSPSQQNLSPTPKKEDLKEYSDPSGFKFFVPKDLLVADKKPKDQSIYTQLELSSSKLEGKITIEAIASTLPTVDSYFKNNKAIPTTTKVEKLQLADLEARQFAIDNEVITVALDKGVLFTITQISKNDKNFWDKVNKTLLASFVFNLPQSQVSDDAASSRSDDSGVTEEEEIVE